MFRARPALCLVLVTSSLAQAGVARASGPAGPSERERAAEDYDRAVSAFERGEHGVAARAFLAADALVANADAVSNAIESARRARDPLLLAEAAERGVSREKSSPWLARRSRAALAEAERQLGRLALACAPAPCEISLDGVTVPDGTRRVLPGTHVVIARASDGRRVERSVNVGVGSEERVALELPPAPKVRAVVASPATAAAHPTGSSVPSAHEPAPAEPAFVRPLFIAGVGVTAALAAATVWSGVDALDARSRLPGTSADNDAVRGKAHRTDALLAGTLIAAAATTYVGIRWIVGSSSRREVAVSVGFYPSAVAVTLTGVD